MFYFCGILFFLHLFSTVPWHTFGDETAPVFWEVKITSWLTLKPQTFPLNHSFPLPWIIPIHPVSLLFSPALFTIQETSVSSDLSLQSHLGVKELAVALALGGQSAPHLLKLILQPSNHLGKVLQLAGVQLLGVLKGVLKAFLLKKARWKERLR